MKKTILFLVGAVLIGVGAYFIGMMKGANLVRNGILQNYPTVYNVIAGSQIEVDTVIDFSIAKGDSSALATLLKVESKQDTFHMVVPYYGRYGINLSRYRRVVPDGNLVEIALPEIKMYYCEIKFDQVLLNGMPLTTKFNGANYTAIKNALYARLLPVLSKEKANREKAKQSVIKSLAYYILPYKFELRIYIDNELQTIPVIPGANKDVDEFINEQFEKK